MTDEDLSDIKLIDFGLSKSISETTGTSNNIVGSLNWMSPETFMKVRNEPRSDIWSLGATIIEMVLIKMYKIYKKPA